MELRYQKLTVPFLLAMIIFLLFVAFSHTVAEGVVEDTFYTRAESVCRQLEVVDKTDDMLLELKRENKHSSLRFQLLGPSGKPMYDSIRKSDPTSMKIVSFEFEHKGSKFQLNAALSKYLLEQMEKSYRSAINWIGAFFSLLLFGAFYLLFRMKRNSLSQRLRNEQESNEKEALLEHLEEGVVIFDEQLRITNANRKAAQILGVMKTYLLGEFFIDKKFITPVASRCLETLKKCQEAGIVINESFSVGGNYPTYYEVVVIPTASKGLVLIIQDQSSHYRLLKMGKDFVANASHELRTPITIIKGFIETLSEMPEISEAMLEDIVGKMFRNCQRMEGLIKNLLILADLDYLPKTHMQKCDVVSIVENCMHMLKTVHPDANVRIQHNMEKSVVLGDSDLLELAIMNLLQNAVKYSSKDPDITVKVEEIVNETRVSIADKGCGIPEKDLKNIFDRFYTVDKARSRKLGGAGLGLSIVKTIIEKHEGNIYATSTEGEGTEFTACLPKS